jgi:orotate phosphoribosyltransferase
MSGVVVAIDRQEKGQNELSATQEVAMKYSVPVISIINLEDIIAYLKSSNRFKSELALIQSYQKSYGII